MRGPDVDLCQRMSLGLQTHSYLASLLCDREFGNKMKTLKPTSIRLPFGNYAYGTEIPAGQRLVVTSGQLGIRADDSIPENCYEQAVICFENIREILRHGKMEPSDIAHISAYVTSRDHMADYMRARDEFLAGTGRIPSSTLLIVSGFTREEFKVEVEVMAAK